jgi:hypothetical protein
MKKTLVLGASHKPERYSNLAMNLLREKGHPVVPVGRRARQFDSWEIIEGQPYFSDIHTVTLYLSAAKQVDFYQYILDLKPERVVFNPGTENPGLYQLLDEKGITWEEACTLVLLQTGQY